MARPGRKKKAGRETSDQLAAMALQSLGSGSAKHAVDLARRARFKGASPERIDPILYFAHSRVARDLEGRGLLDEANAARERASKYRAAAQELSVSSRELVPILKCLPDKDCFATYDRFVRANHPYRDAEMELASRLALNRCFGCLSSYDQGSMFRQDAEVFGAALDPMDRGDWSRSVEMLGALSRGSAFSDWPAFCGAMAAAYRDDNRAAARLVRQISKGFPLQDALKALKTVVGPARLASSRYSLAVNRLGLARVAAARRGESLRQAIRRGRASQIAKALKEFAESVDPDAPLDMRIELARALQLPTLDEFADRSSDDEMTLDVLERVVPTERLEMEDLRAEVQTLASKQTRSCPTIPVALFLSELDSALPDPEARRLAKSRILFQVARRVKEYFYWDFMPYEAGAICGMLGDEEEVSAQRYERNPPSAAADLLRACVAEDPLNKEAHKLLISILHREGRGSMAEIVAAHEDYATAMPEDPEPWIGLAELRLSNLAYRKAEAALAKARAYGSQDERVADLQALTSVVAAQRNFRAGRYLRAIQDIESAGRFGSRRSEGVVRAWTALLRYAHPAGGDLCASFGEALESVTPGVRAQALCVGLDALNSQANKFRVRHKDRQEIEGMLDEAVTALCRENPQDLPRILEPLPDAFSSVGNVDAVPELLGDRWGEVLQATPDRAVFKVFPRAIESNAWRALRKEVSRRLPMSREKTRQRILLLYMATARFLLREDHTWERFQRLKGSIPTSEQPPIRKAAERIADAARRCFADLLAEALERFEFDETDTGLFF